MGVIDQTYTLGQITEVCGTNGTGKTTLFNAFTFALFGKDSNGRTDFGFKRRERDGQVVHNAEYGVRLVFDIDGTERTFERVVTEKWVKPRGGSEKVLSGHETAYYVDNIKCSMKDYNAAVSEIAMEDVLRMLTDVFYFTSLSADTKKAMLLRMAYGTSDSEEADQMAASEVLKKTPTFAAFVDELNGITLRDFNAKNGADISRIKGELNDIPLKIAAKQEAMPAEEDWDGLQAVIDENRAAMEQIDKQIADESARVAGSEQ
jgi:DNA repair exonuclease SbcCD ATPase subunit